MERLKIGIPGWGVGDNSFGVTRAYLSHVTKYGDPIILPPMRGTMNVDMILLPGGKDISTHLYGRPPGYDNSDADQFKEYFLVQNLPLYIQKGTPIWGTCLGAQQLYIHFGGKLDQNISMREHGYSGEDRETPAHPLEIAPAYKNIEPTLLKKQKKRHAFKKEEHNNWLWTNSLHHQGMPVKGMPAELELIASTDDNYVEAFKHKEYPIIGCQFHVEEDYNELGMYLFEELVKTASHDRNSKKPEEENIGTIAD